MNPLQIFEKHPTADAYRVGGFYSPYALVSKDKRFSDAELAAEWWAAAWDYDMYAPSINDPHSLRLRHFADTAHRFATLPNFGA